MTICCECGKDKPSYSQALMGKMVAWKCQECTHNYRIIKFRSEDDEERGIHVMMDELHGGFLINNKLRERLDDYKVKYWLID